VLAAWGLDRPFRGQAALALAPTRVAIGEALTLTLDLQATARRPQKLASTTRCTTSRPTAASPQGLQGLDDLAGAGRVAHLVKRHSMREVTTRRYHPGPHALDVRINGRVVARLPSVAAGDIWLQFLLRTDATFRLVARRPISETWMPPGTRCGWY
jgi:hypothetical protein